jgi:hypothetical protein
MMKKNRNMSNKLYYDNYCKILNEVIISAKKVAYDNYCIKMRDSPGISLIQKEVE